MIPAGSPALTVVLDAFWWASGPHSLRHVQREIILAWQRLYPDDHLVLITRAGAEVASEDLGPNTSIVPTRLWPHAIAATRTARRVAAANRADAILTHNFATRSRGTVSGIYLHDVLFQTNPEWFTRVERGYFSRMIAWARRADVVFTSTTSEARRIERAAGLSDAFPVGLGLSTELIGVQPDADSSLEPGAFVLTVGRLNARKNLQTVIRAAARSRAVSPASPLVIVGTPDGSREELDATLNAEGCRESVRFTGHVSDARLSWLYSNCGAFICLSRGEGFGMPPVEAAFFGAPVVVSDLPVFHETLGVGARFVDPDDADAAAVAIDESVGECTPAAERHDLSRRHDWDRTVRSIRSALSRRGPVSAAA